MCGNFTVTVALKAAMETATSDFEGKLSVRASNCQLLATIALWVNTPWLAGILAYLRPELGPCTGWSHCKNNAIAPNGGQNFYSTNRTYLHSHNLFITKKILPLINCLGDGEFQDPRGAPLARCV